jgi:sialic acid synthase SpsE
VPLDWLPILRDQAHGCGLQFMCSVFLPEAVPLVAPFVDWLKIASFECLDWELVESAAHTAKPLMMSTGMTDARELNLLCGVRDRVGEQVRLLHCISEYPCSPEHLHLDVIEAYGLDGLSEHTTSIFTGAIVVARCPQVGIIERHVRLDDTDPANPDYAPALNPADYRRYVSGVREAEAIQNERRQRKQRNPAEDWARQYRVVNT